MEPKDGTIELEDDESVFLRTGDAITLEFALGAGTHGDSGAVVVRHDVTSIAPTAETKGFLSAESFGDGSIKYERTTEQHAPPLFFDCVFELYGVTSLRALQRASELGGSARKTILYGHAVQLRHMSSGKLVTCLETPFPSEHLALQLGLADASESVGHSSWFRIQPGSKQRSDGEKVRIGDDFYLVSVSSERHVHAHDVSTAVLASFNKTLWRVNIFFTLRKDFDAYVKGGDVVRLVQKHTDDYVASISSGLTEGLSALEPSTAIGHAADDVDADFEHVDVLSTATDEVAPPDWYRDSASRTPGAHVVLQTQRRTEASSFWRIELVGTRWGGRFLSWNEPFRLFSITTGHYLCIDERGAFGFTDHNAGSHTLFCCRMLAGGAGVSDPHHAAPVIGSGMGSPCISFGDAYVFIQHSVRNGMWMHVQEGRATGVRGADAAEGQDAGGFGFADQTERSSPAVLGNRTHHASGTATLDSACRALMGRRHAHMDDAFAVTRVVESDTSDAVIMRTCADRFGSFAASIKSSEVVDDAALGKTEALVNSVCAQFVADATASADQLTKVRRRQALFRRQGLLALVADILDAPQALRLSLNRREEEGDISATAGDTPFRRAIRAFYRLLAAALRGNDESCLFYSESGRLDRLFERAGYQLDVIEVIGVLVEHPGIVQRIRDYHVACLVELLRKHGRSHRVIDLLSALCLCRGQAVRRNQEHVMSELIGRHPDLLLRTQLVAHVETLRPNVSFGYRDGEASSSRWYYEVTVRSREEKSWMLRVGWATTGFQPLPNEGVAVGDDLFSFGFDGARKWHAGRSERYGPGRDLQDGDVVGCYLDLKERLVFFAVNGESCDIAFGGFDTSGSFYPAISVSDGTTIGLNFGQARPFSYRQMEAYSGVHEARSRGRDMEVHPCLFTGKPQSDGGRQVERFELIGPGDYEEHVSFIPKPVDTSLVKLPSEIVPLTELIAENIHDVWSRDKIGAGWTCGERRNDAAKVHNLLKSYAQLTDRDKSYNRDLALETLKVLTQLGYRVISTAAPSDARPTVELPESYRLPNGYKPRPIDTARIQLSEELEALVGIMAENSHDVWAQQRIKEGWTFGFSKDDHSKRNPMLVPFDQLDAQSKENNSMTCREILKTIVGFGFLLEPPPVMDVGREKGLSRKMAGICKNLRSFRASRRFALTRRRWYYEVDLLTDGYMRIGWATDGFSPQPRQGRGVGDDKFSFAFDGYLVRKWNGTSENYGRTWRAGDTVGCLIDLDARRISFSLNGQPLHTGDERAGPAYAFEGFDGGRAFVPAISLAANQRVRVNFGAAPMRYFHLYGLQEGYEPVCNASVHDIAIRYSSDTTTFQQLQDSDGIAMRLVRSSETFCEFVAQQTRPSTTTSEPSVLRLNMGIAGEERGRYCFEVEIHPGQDERNLFVGWATSAYRASPAESSMGLGRFAYLLDGRALAAARPKRTYDDKRRVLCVLDLDEGWVRFVVDGEDLGQEGTPGFTGQHRIERGFRLFPLVCIAPTCPEPVKVRIGRNASMNCESLCATLYGCKNTPGLLRGVSPRRLEFQRLVSPVWRPVDPPAHIVTSIIDRDLVADAAFATAGKVAGDPLSCALHPSSRSLVVRIEETDAVSHLPSLFRGQRLTEYHVSTLRLLSTLCAGGNMLGQDVRRRFLDDQQLVHCIRLEQLPSNVRVAYFDFALALREPLEKLTGEGAATQFVFNSESVSTFDGDGALDQVRSGSLYRKLKMYVLAWMNYRLHAAPVNPTGARGHHWIKDESVAVAMLRLCADMIARGEFSDADIAWLMHAIEPSTFYAAPWAPVPASSFMGLINPNVNEPMQLELCSVFHALCDRLLVMRTRDVVRMADSLVLGCTAAQVAAERTGRGRRSTVAERIRMSVALNDQVEKMLADPKSPSVNRMHMRVLAACRGLGEAFSRAGTSQRTSIDWETEGWLAKHAAVLHSFVRDTVLGWTERQISTPALVQSSAGLLYRQYAIVEELQGALESTRFVRTVEGGSYMTHVVAALREVVRVRMDSKTMDSTRALIEHLYQQCSLPMTSARACAEVQDLLRGISAYEVVIRLMENIVSPEVHAYEAAASLPGLERDVLRKLQATQAPGAHALITQGAGRRGSVRTVPVISEYSAWHEVLREMQQASHFANVEAHEDATGHLAVPTAADMSAIHAFAAAAAAASAAMQELGDLPVGETRDAGEPTPTGRGRALLSRIYARLGLSTVEQRAEFLESTLREWTTPRCASVMDGPWLRPGMSLPEAVTCSRELFATCCRFLVYFCRNNRANQRTVFRHVDFLLGLLGRCLPVAETIAEVLRGNDDLYNLMGDRRIEYVVGHLARNVRAGLYGDHHLSILGLIVRGGDAHTDTNGQSPFDFDKPKSRGQTTTTSGITNAALVLKLLVKRPECLVLSTNSENRQLVAATLGYESHFGSGVLPGDIGYHVDLIELLAMCAPGGFESRTTAVASQGILRSLVSLEDLSAVLCSPLTPTFVKPPFFRYLNDVYGVTNRALFLRLIEQCVMRDLRHIVYATDAPQRERSAQYVYMDLLPFLAAKCDNFREKDAGSAMVYPLMSAVYQLGRNARGAQLTEVTSCVVAHMKQLSPHIFLRLLRRCAQDLLRIVPHTSVILKMLFNFFERHVAYFGFVGDRAFGMASNEERQVAEILFERLYVLVSRDREDLEAQGLLIDALRALCAIGSHLSPDTLTSSVDRNWLRDDDAAFEGAHAIAYRPSPLFTDHIRVPPDLAPLIERMAEHMHETWASERYLRAQRSYLAQQQQLHPPVPPQPHSTPQPPSMQQPPTGHERGRPSLPSLFVPSMGAPAPRTRSPSPVRGPSLFVTQSSQQATQSPPPISSIASPMLSGLPSLAVIVPALQAHALPPPRVTGTRRRDYVPWNECTPAYRERLLGEAREAVRALLALGCTFERVREGPSVVQASFMDKRQLSHASQLSTSSSSPTSLGINFTPKYASDGEATPEGDRTPTYNPKPLNLAGVPVHSALDPIVERLADHRHELWAAAKLSSGWRYGLRPKAGKAVRENPRLVPYDMLTDAEKLPDRKFALDAVKLATVVGFDIKVGAAVDVETTPSGPEQRFAAKLLRMAEESIILAEHVKSQSLNGGGKQHLGRSISVTPSTSSKQNGTPQANGVSPHSPPPQRRRSAASPPERRRRVTIASPTSSPQKQPPPPVTPTPPPAATPPLAQKPPQHPQGSPEFVLHALVPLLTQCVDMHRTYFLGTNANGCASLVERRAAEAVFDRLFRMARARVRSRDVAWCTLASLRAFNFCFQSMLRALAPEAFAKHLTSCLDDICRAGESPEQVFSVALPCVAEFCRRVPKGRLGDVAGTRPLQELFRATLCLLEGPSIDIPLRRTCIGSALEAMVGLLPPDSVANADVSVVPSVEAALDLLREVSAGRKDKRRAFVVESLIPLVCGYASAHAPAGPEGEAMVADAFGSVVRLIGGKDRELKVRPLVRSAMSLVERLPPPCVVRHFDVATHQIATAFNIFSRNEGSRLEGTDEDSAEKRWLYVSIDALVQLFSRHFDVHEWFWRDVTTAREAAPLRTASVTSMSAPAHPIVASADEWDAFSRLFSGLAKLFNHRFDVRDLPTARDRDETGVRACLRKMVPIKMQRLGAYETVVRMAVGKLLPSGSGPASAHVHAQTPSPATTTAVSANASTAGTGSAAKGAAEEVVVPTPDKEDLCEFVRAEIARIPQPPAPAHDSRLTAAFDVLVPTGLSSLLGRRRRLTDEEVRREAERSVCELAELLSRLQREPVESLWKRSTRVYLHRHRYSEIGGWLRQLVRRRHINYTEMSAHDTLVNLVVRRYVTLWIAPLADTGKDAMIADMKLHERGSAEADRVRVRQIIGMFHDAPLDQAADPLYLNLARILSRSCQLQEAPVTDPTPLSVSTSARESENDEEEGEVSFEDKEREKRELRSRQAHLSERGCVEMAVHLISVSYGRITPLLHEVIRLAIALLDGGNEEVQGRMLAYLLKSKDAKFFSSVTGLVTHCSVLDHEAWGRKALALSLGMDYDEFSGPQTESAFACDLFRFLQLLCEGHNLDFQNYLRTQPGNTKTYNIVVSTVDYLLRLQEKFGDVYWFYQNRSTLDDAGWRLFSESLRIANQVFTTLTEYVQGPCRLNQLALAGSRLSDAVNGFFTIFAGLYRKLSADAAQVELLRQFCEVQLSLVQTLTSMLEGNAKSDLIAHHMIEAFSEGFAAIEETLRFCDVYISLNDLATSEVFETFDINGDGCISASEFETVMRRHLTYSEQQIRFLLTCADANKDGRLDYREFTNRFHEESLEMSFMIVVLLKSLGELSGRPDAFADSPGFRRLEEYFRNNLGRIEIIGKSGSPEFIYFKIEDDWKRQWEKPQVQESKRQFLAEVMTEHSTKRLEEYVGFCEDTIFEMQYSARVFGEEKTHHVSPDEARPPASQSIAADGYRVAASAADAITSVATLPVTIVSDAWRSANSAIRSGLSRIRTALTPVARAADDQAQRAVSFDDSTARGRADSSGRGLRRRRQDTIYRVAEAEQRPLARAEAERAQQHVPRIEIEATNAAPAAQAGQQGPPTASAAPTTESNAQGAGGAPPPRRSATAYTFKSIMARTYHGARNVAFATTVLLNITLLFVRVDDITGMGTIEADGDEFVIDDGVVLRTQQVLPYVHFAASVCMLIGYYCLKYPVHIFRREKAIVRMLEWGGMWITQREPPEWTDVLWYHWDRMAIACRSFPSNYWDKYVKRRVRERYGEEKAQELSNILGPDDQCGEPVAPPRSVRGHIAAYGRRAFVWVLATAGVHKPEDIDVVYTIWKAGVILGGHDFFYNILYVAFSFLGLYSPFFYAAHLLDIAVRNKTLRNVLRSVTFNGWQLLLTVMMMSIVIYIYTVFAFTFFRKFYNVCDEAHDCSVIEHKCHSMFQCFIFHLSVGLRQGGGIGDVLQDADGDPKESYRIMFDLSFFLIVIVILLAIVQGLIIDSFGELRNIQNEVTMEMETKCIVCGASRDTLDAVPHGFERHTAEEHNLWNYLFFIMHLKYKPETEYTGQESYVHEMLIKRCMDFFPIGRGDSADATDDAAGAAPRDADLERAVATVISRMQQARN